MMPARTILTAVAVASLSLVLPTPAVHAASDPVAAMTAPLYQRVNPATRADLVTPWADEASAAASSYNFTTDLGTPFSAATGSVDGLSPVHRLFKWSTSDFTWALEGSTQLSAARTHGYDDQGVDFYAAPTPLAGTVPVNSYVSGAIHRLWLGSDSAALTSKGWTLETTAFYVPGTAVPTPPPPPPPPPSGGQPTGTTGAAQVGSTAYPVPANAVFVSPTGDDDAGGTVGAPVRTIARAVDLAPAGGTVVLRQGTYHESVTIESKAVTLQNYPNEAAWLDGAEAVTGWVQDGSTWRRDGWTTRFDHSPTYIRGAPDNTEPGWQFVDPKYPMAPYPDQVFVDGVALQQVQTRSQVKPGTFYLDEATSRLFIGSNPNGHQVDASTLVKGLAIRAEGTVVRGIGIRRFAPSIPDIGTVSLEAPHIRFENVAVLDSATIGLAVVDTDCVLDHVTVKSSGLLGLHIANADRLVMSSVLSTLNNDEHFNIAPVSGGAKLGTTRGISVSNSSFSGNYGYGFWEDESNYDTVLRSSTFSDNSAAGVFLEISAKAVVVDNLVARNQGEGIKVNNTSDVKIWNNTLVGNIGRPLDLVQDDRRNTDPNNGAVDHRQPFPDPTMPWTLGPVVVANNIVEQAAGNANCLLCVEDYTYQDSGEAMGISSNGNVYQRPSTSAPTWLVVWSSGGVDPYVFDSLGDFQGATGQDKRSREYVGGAAADDNGQLTQTVTALVSTIAEPLPSDIAGIVGRPTGTQHLGRW